MADQPTIFVLNGPNLNLLGTREPDVYGTMTLDDIAEIVRKQIAPYDIEMRSEQSNHEGTLIDIIHEARNWADGIIFNPGAYTHTSIGIADAIKAITTPVVEVHISNTFSRETFRHQSFISPHAKGVIIGFGLHSYHLAIQSFL